MKKWQKDIIPELDNQNLVLKDFGYSFENKVHFVIYKYWPEFERSIYYCHTKAYGRNNALKIAKRFNILEEIKEFFK